MKKASETPHARERARGPFLDKKEPRDEQQEEEEEEFYLLFHTRSREKSIINHRGAYTF